MKYSNETRKVLLAEMAERLWADPEAVVREAESRCKSALEEVCRTAAAEDTNVILLSGPSASGKTTSAHRIAGGLEHMGKKARIISLDNFYKPHDRLPLWPNGTLNFESVDGLDTECLGDCLNQLWQKGCADFPIFDFETQNRSAQTMKTCISASPKLLSTLLSIWNTPAIAPPAPAPMETHCATLARSCDSGDEVATIPQRATSWNE